MPITLTDDSATIGTAEYFLASDSTAATYQTTDCILQTFLDLSNLAAGDEYRIKFYERVNAGTVRAFYQATVIGAQAELWVSPAFIVGDGWEVSLAKIAGTDRSIAWSLRKIT